MKFYFTVNQFMTETSTGFTRIVIAYNFGQQHETDERGFESPQRAQGYIDTMRRDWLSRMFNKYVRACRIIFEKTPNNDYYKEQSRLDALQRCVNGGLIIAAEKSLPVVAGYIASSAAILHQILPHSNNNSFATADERLSAMQQVAKEYLQSLKKKTPVSA